MAKERVRRVFRPISKSIFVLLILLSLLNHFVIIFFPDTVFEALDEFRRLFPGIPFRSIYLDFQTTLLLISVGLILILEGLSLLFVNNDAALLEEGLVDELTKIDIVKKTNLVMIPAYNEAETIEEAITIGKTAGAVLVIDDGSTDGTLALAREFATHVIHHTKNLGLAQGIMNGIDFALSKGYKSMVIYDADMQYTEKDLQNVVKILQNSDYDIVMGSRLKGSIEKMKITKRFGNWIFSKTLSYITGIPISDGQTGLRCFTDVFASHINFRGQFTYTQEMLFETSKHNFSLGEIPIEFKERVSGESRLMAGAIDYALRAWNVNIQIIAEYNPIKFSLGMMAFLILQALLILNNNFSLQTVSVMLFISIYVILFTLGIYASILINRVQQLNTKRKYQAIK